jgi:hypothetical protein
VLPFTVVTAQIPVSPSDEQVVAALRIVGATKRLTVAQRVQPYFVTLGYDLEDVADWISDCEQDELHRHEPDDKGRSDHVAVLKIYAEEELLPFYVKIALQLPEMTSGKLLSFKPWT